MFLAALVVHEVVRERPQRNLPKAINFNLTDINFLSSVEQFPPHPADHRSVISAEISRCFDSFKPVRFGDPFHQKLELLVAGDAASKVETVDWNVLGVQICQHVAYFALNLAERSKLNARTQVEQLLEAQIGGVPLVHRFEVSFLLTLVKLPF